MDLGRFDSVLEPDEVDGRAKREQLKSYRYSSAPLRGPFSILLESNKKIKYVLFFRNR